KLEGGLGIGFYSRSVPTLYAFQTFQDGSDINNELKLRIVPFTATARFLPLGHHSGIVPYIGGGVGVFAWHYSESGQFVDANNNIFRNTYTGSGSAAGPVILGGARLALGQIEPAFEVRWQSA